MTIFSKSILLPEAAFDAEPTSHAHQPPHPVERLRRGRDPVVGTLLARARAGQALPVQVSQERMHGVRDDVLHDQGEAIVGCREAQRLQRAARVALPSSRLLDLDVLEAHARQAVLLGDKPPEATACSRRGDRRNQRVGAARKAARSVGSRRTRA